MSNPRKFSLLSTFLVALLLVVAIGSGTLGTARAEADELFFSEYIEGSSNNKALEIYNGTGSAIDLGADGYNIQIFFNGSVTAGLTINLTGTVADGDVYVVAQSSASAAILAQADQTNGSGWYNGDDAVVLRRGTTVIDSIGQVGFDPGSQWGDGLTSTADNTLHRKSDVCAGDTHADNAFDPSAEWDGFAQDTFDGLGVHTANCDSPPVATVINEVLASTTGTDVEYIELYGEPEASLAGLSLIYVESNNGTSLGAIDFRHDFAPGDTLGLNGFYLIGTTASLQSVYGVTPNADIAANSLENSSATVALVETASLSGSTVSGSETVLDTVGITDANASTFFFGAPVIGPDGSFFPAGVRRVTDGVDTDTAADWLIADFNLGSANTPTAGTTADVAPTVTATNPATDAANVPVGSSVSVTFSESVNVAAGAISVECPVGTQVASNDAASAITSVTIEPASDLPELTTCTIVIDANGVTDNDGAPDPLTGTTSFSFTTGTASGISPISSIQGSGDAAAVGTFTVEAIVVGDYQTQGSGELRGFFIQEEDADADANPATSEGIFVFCSSCPVDVSVGDAVSVTGSSSDFFGMSQLSATTADAVTVLSTGNPLPTPAVIDLPASGSTRAETTFEHVEGMLVTFSDTLVVSEYFELARYGQLVLTADARPRQFTDANEPSINGYTAFLNDLNSSRIILDDDNNVQNDAITGTADEPYFWPRPGLSTTNFVRGGDSISNLTGVMHWSFAGQSGTDAWRLRPVEHPSISYDFTSVNERTTAPEGVGGSLKVASFNVLNYFTTMDSRGADSQTELDRQRAKIAAAVCAMDADIVGLIEIENNGSVALLDLLNGADGINANCGPYGYIDTGMIGTDQIAVAFIYRTATVSPVGDYAVLDSSVDPRFLDDFNRPALAQTFRETATGGVFTVVVNHLKSKGSSCSAIGDPDVGDGQGNCNLTRTAAAEAMVDWLATDPTGSGDSDFLIIGDLNSYRNEDPIDAIELGSDDIAGTADDYVDLLDTLIGPSAYTYVFDGQLGYLDHALANNALFRQVTGVTAWNINADEIPVFDYNDNIDDGSSESSFERESSALPIYEPNAYRSSDHDAVIVGLDLNGSPVCDGALPSISSIWPPDHMFRDIEVLGLTDPEGDAITITIDSIFQDEAVDADESGNTAPDGMGVGTSIAQVRAERVGTDGNGRVYHIFFTAADTAGGSCSGEVLVSVPIARHITAVDDGAQFDSTETPE